MYTYDQALERAVSIRGRWGDRIAEVCVDEDLASGMSEREMREAAVWFLRVFRVSSGEFLYNVGLPIPPD